MSTASLSVLAQCSSPLRFTVPPPALPARAETDWRPLMMAERKRSAVWSYFTVSDIETATCDISRKTIRFCGNTTNLYKHLKAAHPKVNTSTKKYQYRQYWPCNYLVLDRYQNLQCPPPLLSVPKVRTELGKTVFRFAAPSAWDMLQETLNKMSWSQ